MIFTETLILSNIIMFILVKTHLFSAIDLGSAYSLVLGRKQYSRLITSAFTHEQIWHIGMNMYSLWNVGASLERAIGGMYVFVAYFLTAIIGGLVTIFIRKAKKQNVLSIGASGSICGLIGVYIVLLYKASQVAGTTAFLSSLFSMLLVAVLIRRADNLTHITCMGAGILLGIIFL